MEEAVESSFSNIELSRGSLGHIFHANQTHPDVADLQHEKQREVEEQQHLQVVES